MIMRLLLLVCGAAAAMCHTVVTVKAIRHAAVTTSASARRATMPSCGLDSVVEQQAREIADLRRQVAKLQAERDGQRGHGQKRRNAKSPADARAYHLHGELPDGFDSSPVEQLLARRMSAKLKKHYSEADRLQHRLQRMGVRVDDTNRRWTVLSDWRQRQAQLAEADERVGRQQQVLQHELERRIKDIFRRWDQDGNGLVDRDEFRLAMEILAIPGGAEAYDAKFDAWDVDKNGGLNFKEIRQALLHDSENAEVPRDEALRLLEQALEVESERLQAGDE